MADHVPPRGFAASSIAFGFGALVGAASALAEALVPSAALPPEAFAAYAVLGGMAAVGARVWWWAGSTT